MDDKEILKKALIQADMFDNDMFYGEHTYDREWDLSGMKLSHGEYDDYQEISVRDLIFDHDFAKVFFGTEFFSEDGDYSYNDGEMWEHHFLEMVIEENPIKYLERFLKGKV